MPISVTCPECKHTLKVKDELAGKRGKCPKCQATIAIPAATPPAKPAAAAPIPSPPKPSVPAPIASPVAPARKALPTGEDLRSVVLAAFQGTCEPPKVGLSRKLATLFILSILLLLPLVYLTAVAGLIYGLYWLATSNYGQQLAPLIYWTAVSLGGFLLICLLKPLLMPRRKSVEAYPLSTEKEKLFTEVTARICELINAPVPATIRFECSTRLSAEYRAGLLGLLRRDVVLTIGLPLMGSLSLRQFAGLVAAELAQFRSRAACRLTNMIRAINGWLWRTIYEEDRFDAWLSRQFARRGFRVGKLLYPLRAMKFVAQVVAWIPMFIGNTAASALVHRTELDSDLCHARLSGASAFGPTLDRLEIIDFTWQGILMELDFLHREQQLPDSLPHQLQLRMFDMTPDICATLLETVVKTEEKPFDSRPNKADRIATVERDSAAGVVSGELPAYVLLADYEKLAKQMTLDYYSRSFGGQLLKTGMKRVILPG